MVTSGTLPAATLLFANYVHTINVLHESHFIGNLQEIFSISNEQVQINEAPHWLPGRFGDENENRERNEILLVLVLT